MQGQSSSTSARDRRTAPFFRSSIIFSACFSEPDHASVGSHRKLCTRAGLIARKEPTPNASCWCLINRRYSESKCRSTCVCATIMHQQPFMAMCTQGTIYCSRKRSSTRVLKAYDLSTTCPLFQHFEEQTSVGALLVCAKERWPWIASKLCMPWSSGLLVAISELRFVHYACYLQ
jgi:hypothetical protein